MTNRSLVRFLALLFTTALIAPTIAQAQTLSADEKELRNYTLTMPTVRKVASAMRAFNELESQDPKVKELAKIRAEIEALENKDELTDADQEKLEKLRERGEALDEEIDGSSGPGDANTIDDMEKRIKSEPRAAAILAREGLTAREFAKCTLALLQAAMIQGFSQGKVDMAKLPAGINPANIKFVQENEKELAELQKQMQGPKKQ